MAIYEHAMARLSGRYPEASFWERVGKFIDIPSPCAPSPFAMCSRPQKYKRDAIGLPVEFNMECVLGSPGLRLQYLT
jgi:hypothetical protein